MTVYTLGCGGWGDPRFWLFLKLTPQEPTLWLGGIVFTSKGGEGEGWGYLDRQPNGRARLTLMGLARYAVG